MIVVPPMRRQKAVVDLNAATVETRQEFRVERIDSEIHLIYSTGRLVFSRAVAAALAKKLVESIAEELAGVPSRPEVYHHG